MILRAGRAAAAVAALCAAAACGGSVDLPGPALAAADTIDAGRVEEAMTALADDAMGGRGTGQPGYDRAAQWLADRFEALGLEPAGVDGSWFQPVPIIASRLDVESSSLRWERDDVDVEWIIGEDAIVSPDPMRARAEVAAPLVFAGYGVHAPELGYDDWAGLELDGAIAVVFRGAPASFAPPLRALHSSTERTRRLAAERGAAGLLWLLTPEGHASQPWERRLRLSAHESMERIDRDGRPVGAHEQLAAEVTLSKAAADALLDAAGLDAAAVVAGLDAGRPAGTVLPGTIRIRTVSSHRRLESPNVLARIPGSDPDLAAQHVVLTGHLDHLGVGSPEDGDDIYNGAYDNASGIAIMLEIARAVAEADERPARSLLLLAVTGEERGLLGSAHWVDEPTVPIDDVIADVNLDMVLMLHPLRELIAFGAEHSTLGDVVEAAAERYGVVLSPDPFPDEVIFVRSDQYSFVKAGIPAVFLWSGVHDGESRASGLERWRVWMRQTYHSPRDDVDQAFDLEAGATMARINLLIAWSVADAQSPPRWHEGDVFGERFGAGREPAYERIFASASRS